MNDSSNFPELLRIHAGYDQLLRLQQRTYQPAPDIRAFGNIDTQWIAYNLIQGRYRVVYLSNQLGVCFL